VTTGLPAIFILLAVGALIGAWALSGTLIAMVYYGLQLLSPDYFYPTTCLICLVVAVSIGSSWTVAGTLGIGLMGVAREMGLDPAITAGAVISGAYFGDKLSPLSGTANLACAAAGANLYEHFGESLRTSVPSLLAALVLFWSLGTPVAFDPASATESIEAAFQPSSVHFIPLALVLALAIMRWPPFVAIFLGALAGGILAVVDAPDRVIAFAGEGLPHGLGLLKGVWATLSGGYVSDTGEPAIDQLLTRGGMASMLGTVWLILVALAFGGFIERAGVLERLIGPLIARARSGGALVTTLVGAAFGTNVLASDQYIAVVLPGRMFRPAFEKRGLAPVVLSRTLGDSAAVTSPLVPWNSCGAYMAATLGVATTAYVPFAFFNLLNPLVSIAFAFLGLRMLRRASIPPDPKPVGREADKP
jgi:NhaC family Na+:H+ antiporter